MKKSGPRILKSKEAAHILDISPDDVIALARTGKLKGRKEGRYWKFNWTDITAYRRKLERTAAA